MSTLQEDIEGGRDTLIAAANLLHAIVHGPDAGAGSLVTTENGDVKSVARALAEIGDTSNQALRDLSNVLDADFLAKAAAAGVGTGALLAANDLSDLADAAAARGNLSVYSTTATDAAIATAVAAAVDGVPSAAQVGQNTTNIGLVALRQVEGWGWTIQQMVDGFVDAFTDQSGVSVDTETVLAQGEGTAIGDMTGGGGLAAAFDGNDDQAFGSVASADGPAEGYVGKDWGSGIARKISRVQTWGANDNGYGGSGANYTLKLWGSNTAPTAWNDGTEIGAIATNQSDANNADAQDASFDISTQTAYRYHWVSVENLSGTWCYMAEVIFTEGIEGDSVNAIYDAAGDYFSSNPTTLIPQGDGTEIGSLSPLANAFDGDNENNSGSARDASAKTGTAGKDWGVGNAKTVSRVIVQAPTDGFEGDGTEDASVTIKVYTTTDGTASGGTEVASLSTTDSNGGEYTLNIGSPAATRSIYVEVTHTGSGNRIGVGEVEFYEAASGEMELISKSQTADAQPDTSRAVLVVQPVDAITLNTDLFVDVSRDGGSTWETGTLTEEGDYDANSQVYVADGTDLSGQPAGTDMRIRVRTPTGKEVRVHAWTLQWR